MTRAMYSIDAEQSVIGAVLLKPVVVDQLADIVTPNDFYHASHRLIWSAIIEMSCSNRPVDVVSVFDLLENKGQSEQCGGIAVLAEIARNTPSTHNAVHYARSIAEYSRLRRVVGEFDTLRNEALNSRDDSDLIVDRAQSRLLSIVEDPSSSEPMLIGDYMMDMVEMMDRRFRGEESPMGTPFGIPDLDRLTMGAHPGQLIVVAGRPSMGKTAFMLNMVRAALRSGPVITFSLEMDKAALRDRMTAAVGDLPMAAIKDPRMHMPDDGWQKLTTAVTQLKDAKYVIDDRAALSPSQIRGACKRWKQRFGTLSLITIDYLQLMRPDIKTDSREQQVASMSRAMKELAKEMQCPVVLLSQLNRSLEQRPDKRPRMSDLRESGAIEQDADLILFPYRDEVYTKAQCQTPGVAEIIIGKQRDGQLGTVYTYAHLDRMQFIGMSPETVERMHSNQAVARKPKAAKSAMAMI